jgi:hypothetical protein
MITALMVGGLVSCSEDEQTSSTTQDQTTVAVEDETTTTSTVDQATSTTSLTATSTVTVTVTNVEDAVGYDMAGVLYEGDNTLIANIVGGFGAAVDADPFSTTQVVRAPQPGNWPEDFDRDADWPYVTDEPVMLEPGTYTLQLWLGEPPLCCYLDPFLPNGSPTLSGCTTVFTVKEDEQVNITVNGIPSVTVPNNTSCATG